MRSKKFKFRKRQVQTRMNGVLSLTLVTLFFIVYMSLGYALPLQIMAVFALVAILVGSRADKVKNGYFYVDADELVLKNARSRRRLGMRQIKDVSIVDSGAAKRYIYGRIEDSDNTLSSTKRKHIYMQFCTVEIALEPGLVSRFLALMQSTIPAKNDDLVLLRMQDGTDLLLSPVHANDAVSYLNRMMESLRKKDSGGQSSLFQAQNAANT